MLYEQAITQPWDQPRASPDRKDGGLHPIENAEVENDSGGT